MLYAHLPFGSPAACSGRQAPRTTCSPLADHMAGLPGVGKAPPARTPVRFELVASPCLPLVLR
jgi:hypothetical protein